MDAPPDDVDAFAQSSLPKGAAGPKWLQRMRSRVVGESKWRRVAWRVVATAIGVAIVLGGIALLPLPGPGWAIIFLGLAILATEYEWARRLLVFTKDKAQGATSSAFGSEHRNRTIAVLVVGGLLLAAVVAWYVTAYGWTLDGPRSWL